MNNNKKAVKKNIILTGFMATGKTATGKELARRLKRRFVDTDQVVEEAAGMKIRDIFEKDGEDRFRDLESVAVAGLESHPAGSLVVATGGGVLMRKENLASLKKHGLLVLLTATPQVIIERVSKTEERPLLDGPDPEKKVKALLARREQCYRACDFNIDTTAKSVQEVAEEIIDYLS